MGDLEATDGRARPALSAMDRSLFDYDESTVFSPERLARAVSDLADKQWAGFCMDAGIRSLRAGRAALWVPRLALVAALRLARTAEVLPLYERWLLRLDSLSKNDWHEAISRQGLAGNLLHQSGRLDQTERVFRPEFERIVSSLAPEEDRLIVDIGCGGGLWAINLAKMGFRVLGTEHHAFLIDAARRNAALAGVEDKVEFQVDDIRNSALRTGLCTRALCIGVTPTLGSDPDFAALLQHVDRITKCDRPSEPRRVVLGSNRWGPTRMRAVLGILDAASQERQSVSRRLGNAARRPFPARGLLVAPAPAHRSGPIAVSEHPAHRGDARRDRRYASRSAVELRCRP